MVLDQLEVALDDALPSSSVGTKPGIVSGRAARVAAKVIVGRDGIGLGASSGGVELRLSECRATDEGSPLGMDVGVGNGEVTGELDLGDVLNSGVEILGTAISVDVGEKVRCLDGVVSGPGFGEVVNSGD